MDVKDHKHLWTDNDPDLFLRNLRRCLRCGEVAPQDCCRFHDTSCGKVDFCCDECPAYGHDTAA